MSSPLLQNEIEALRRIGKFHGQDEVEVEKRPTLLFGYKGASGRFYWSTSYGWVRGRTTSSGVLALDYCVTCVKVLEKLPGPAVDLWWSERCIEQHTVNRFETLPAEIRREIQVKDNIYKELFNG